MEQYIRNTNQTSRLDWAKAEVLLWKSSHILAITHYAPDGDALGSLLGFAHAMRDLGKVVSPCCQDVPDNRFNYLPGIETMLQSADDDDFDLIVSLDADLISRLGTVFVLSKHGSVPILVIDHHKTNNYFGSVNIVEPNMSSTCEIILKLLKLMSALITSDIATCLLTGIVTDTLNFRNANTKSDTLVAASELMSFGASLEYIIRESLIRTSFDWLRILGIGIGLTIIENNIAYASIPYKARKDLSLPDEGDGGLVGMLLSVIGVEIVAVFEE